MFRGALGGRDGWGEVMGEGADGGGAIFVWRRGNRRGG